MALMLVGEAKDNAECLAVGSMDLWQSTEPKHMKPSANASASNPPAAPTARGGIRRKHHRTWTLSEVRKLIEGVSRYGAGRWSQTKSIAFASYSYRTSVDLKVNFRKHTSMLIPASVLSRVRELAQMQAQVPMKFSPNQPIANDMNVDDCEGHSFGKN